MINRKVLVVVVAVVIVSVILAYSGLLQKKKVPVIEPVKASDFTLKDMAGKPVTLSNYFSGNGNVVVLDIWATWCLNCTRVAPELVELQSQYKGKSFKVVAVAIDEKTATVKAFARENHLNYTILHDPFAEILSKLYVVRGIPVTYVIDRKGFVRYSHYGLPNDREGQKKVFRKLKQEIDSLL